MPANWQRGSSPRSRWLVGTKPCIGGFCPLPVPFQVLGALDPAPAHRFFLVREWVDEYPEAIATLAEWIREGRLRYRETIAEGLESAPRAFIGLLRGENLGKQLVRIAEAE